MYHRNTILAGAALALSCLLIHPASAVRASTVTLPGACDDTTSESDATGLSRSQAADVAERTWKAYAESIRKEQQQELDALLITHGEYELRLLRQNFGEIEHDDSPSLWISLHGGGNASQEVNDRQWQNQLRLYQPDEGIYIAPRAPTNTWNLWHRAEIDRLFDRLIESAIVVWNVDPDRVYLLGYSAGGDGVYQLAPRMADRFAAAAMMAGHPNDAAPEGLRNLPFAIFMGGRDTAYNRNTVAEQWEQRLEALQEADPDGYPHRVEIYPDMGHWMQGRDAEAVPWMASHVRNLWPKRIVWKQGNVSHNRFYWLAVATEDAARGNTIIATVHEQAIHIESDDVKRIELLLHDELIDLNKPIRIMFNDQVVYEGSVLRTEEAIRRSLQLRADPRGLATATLTVTSSSSADNRE